MVTPNPTTVLPAAAPAKGPGISAHEQEQIRYIKQLNQEAYWWLGSRMERLDAVRQAGQSGERRSLEREMAATRSALGMVTKVFRLGLVSAYNSTFDEVANIREAAGLLGPKLNHSPQAGPPIRDVHDALLVCWAPLRFLNIASSLRSGSKGLEFYSDELVKKIYYKVIAYYCDISRWNANTLGRFVGNLGEAPPMEVVRGKLSRLKTDIELLTHSHHMFYFQVSTKQHENMFAFTPQEAVRDLYLQSWLINGFEQFVFRYCLTLMEACESDRALSEIQRMFRPLLKKCEQVSLDFYFSLRNNPQKARLRDHFLVFAQKIEAPTPEGKTGGRHHQGLVNAFSFSRVKVPSSRQLRNWQGYIQRNIFNRGLDNPRAANLLAELINMEMACTEDTAGVREETAKMLLQHSETQETQAMSAIREQHAAMQKEMVKKREQGMAHSDIEAYRIDHTKRLATMNKTVKQVVSGLHTRSRRVQQSADQLKGPLQIRSAKAFYTMVQQCTSEPEKVSVMLVKHLHALLNRPGRNESYSLLYRHLFEIVEDIPLEERVDIRQAIAAKLGFVLDNISKEEQEFLLERRQVLLQKLQGKYPGIMHCHVAPARLQKIPGMPIVGLLNLRLTQTSFQTLISCPMMWNKKTTPLPEDAIKQLVVLNNLQMPPPKHDILFEAVNTTTPPTGRINFDELNSMIEKLR